MDLKKAPFNQYFPNAKELQIEKPLYVMQFTTTSLLRSYKHQKPNVSKTKTVSGKENTQTKHL
jgi:hypothetical protein